MPTVTDDLTNEPNGGITETNGAGDGTPEDTPSQLTELTRQLSEQSQAISEMRAERQHFERQMADLIRNLGTSNATATQPEPEREPEPKMISFAEMGRGLGQHKHDNVNMRRED